MIIPARFYVTLSNEGIGFGRQENGGPNGVRPGAADGLGREEILSTAKAPGATS
jgi:hypothetical protein